MTKYYAVKKGKNPGIYTSWEECENEVKGFPSAVFKSFDSYEKAQSYLKDEKNQNNSMITTKENTKVFYAVVKGFIPGIYTSWEDAFKQVAGYSGAVYKKFDTIDKAKQYIDHSARYPKAKLETTTTTTLKEEITTTLNDELVGTPIKLLTERISYQNENKKWKLFLFQLEDSNTIKISGIFDNDFEIGKRYAIYGQNSVYQDSPSFQVASYHWQKPISKNGIISYLKTLKGLKQKAEIIYNTFKDESIDMIKNHPEVVAKTIKGIGLKSVEKWQEQLLVQSGREDTMRTLFDFGLSEHYVYRLIEEIGEESIDIIKKNPYQLIDLLSGVGFKRCDDIALQSGMKINDFNRIKECLLYVVKDNEVQGHCYIEKEDLILKSKKFLDLTLDITEMESIKKSNLQSIEKYQYLYPIDHIKINVSLASRIPYVLLEVTLKEIENCLKELIKKDTLIEEDQHIYLKNMYEIEKKVAKKLLDINSNKFIVHSKEKVEQILNQVCQDLHVELEDKQREACINFNVSNQGIYILNGSAGTGKTFTLSMIIEISRRLYSLSDKDILAVAPTGKAAKVMEESIQLACRTIHRAIGYSKNQEEIQLISQSFIVCDEASMLDIRLANIFLKALSNQVKLIIMGDSKQLPSIGAGNVLKDIIASSKLEVVTLNVIKRQGLLSGILHNANRVIEAKMIKNDNDFRFMEVTNTKKARNYIIHELMRLQKEEDMSFEDMVLLVPQRKGEVGVDAFNYLIQKYLNPIKKEDKKILKKTLELTNQEIRKIYIHQNDRVIQNRNDYQKEIYRYQNEQYVLTSKKGIFNGETGFVKEIIEMKDQLRVVVSFEIGYVFYDHNVEDIDLSFALTIHKAQGAQWHTVFILASRSHMYMLSNNLLYTAITRAKKECIVIGDSSAIEYAIKNKREDNRLTTLDKRLIEESNAKVVL